MLETPNCTATGYNTDATIMTKVKDTTQHECLIALHKPVAHTLLIVEDDEPLLVHSSGGARYESR
jgi:hypothetical protein